MNKILTFLLLLMSTNPAFSQTSYYKIDKQSKIVPSNLVNAKEIAQYLTKDLPTQKAKVRAIYIWITHNIEYDLSLLLSESGYGNKEKKIKDVLSNRKGVCEHYADLLDVMCQSIGVQSFVISGYTKEANGVLPNNSHAWNGLRIGKEYTFIDATWAAGYHDEKTNKYVPKFNDKYFMVAPKEFIKTHMPFDPIWQFLDTPIDNVEFMKKDLSKLKGKGNFVYRDSIKSTMKLDSLSQLEAANRRLKKNKLNNKLVQNQYNYNTFNIAIANLNKGINSFNAYIKHKNKFFKNPKVDDNKIKSLIANAYNGIVNAIETIKNVKTENKHLIQAKNKILADYQTTLTPTVKKEKTFVDHYLRKKRPFRFFLFFKKEYR